MPNFVPHIKPKHWKIIKDNNAIFVKRGNKALAVHPDYAHEICNTFNRYENKVVKLTNDLYETRHRS